MEINAIRQQMVELDKQAIEQLTTLVRNCGGRIDISDDYESRQATWKCSDNGSMDVDVEALAYSCDDYGHGPTLCIVTRRLHSSKDWLLPISQFEMGTAMQLYEHAHNAATGDRQWAQVSHLVETANEHLDSLDIKVQIHIERYQQGDNYFVYTIYDEGDTDIKDGDVLLDDAPDVIERVWRDVVACYTDDEDEDTDETVRLRRLSGGTHDGEANEIYSYADCLLFFIHKRGAVDVVDGDIDRFIHEDGYFAVNSEDYHEAMRQVWKHENGFEN